MKQFAPELAKFKTGRGSIQFPLDQPLPAALIRKLTRERVRLSRERDGKWKTGPGGRSKDGGKTVTGRRVANQK